MKPLWWRETARRDLTEAVAWYAREGGLTLELRFIAATAAATSLIAQHPGAGATRHAAFIPDLPGLLRFLPVRHFERHLIYYLDLPTHIEVVRLWHASRGLDALMGEEAE